MPPRRRPPAAASPASGTRRSTRKKEPVHASDVDGEELDVYQEEEREEPVQDEPKRKRPAEPTKKARQPRRTRESIAKKTTRAGRNNTMDNTRDNTRDNAVDNTIDNAVDNNMDNTRDSAVDDEYFEITFNDAPDVYGEDSDGADDGDNGLRQRRAPRGGSASDEQLLARKRHERAVRVAARHTHLACLLVSLSFYSRAISTPLRRAHLLSTVPPHLLRQFAPEILRDGRTLLNALSMLSNWWKNSNRDTPRSVLDLVSTFATILRALGLRARLICSLQPLRTDGSSGDTSTGDLASPSTVPPKTPLGRSVTPKTHDDTRTSSGRSITSRTLGDSKAVSVISNSSSSSSPTKPSAKAPSAPPPVFWCEAYHPREARWVPVDCVRAIVNDRLAMEPPALGRLSRQHLFIVGFDAIGRAVDVTRRYTSQYHSVTAKRRRLDERVLEEGLKLLRGRLRRAEEAELAGLVDGEPIPTTAAGFQGHGRYMLDKQLKKYEVFWPAGAGIVGEFRGQPVRLRSVVQKARSREAWYTQFGRIVREGEEPCKQVVLPALPPRKKKKDGFDNNLPALPPPEDAAPRLQPLFGEWQTEPYSPPVAVDGQVPRNKFNNVDLYLPSMMPVGCVWIDDQSAYLAARDLGVDYAAACVRFAFSGRFACPNLRGIVVCAEFEGAVRRRLAEIKIELAATVAEREEEARAKKARLEGRRKRIQEKIEQEHGISSGGEEPDVIVSTLARPGALDNDEGDLDLFE